MKAKGSLAAPLFFVSLALACASSRLGNVMPWALSALALAAAGWAGASQARASSRLAIAVFGFSLLVAFNTLVISPAYTPAGLYHPLLLTLAFAAFRRFDDMTERRAACAALGLGALLSAWGLVQIGFLGVARANALFETPATYAAVINLLLVPALALLLCGVRRASIVGIGALLAAALFAADSRGGLLGLAAGLGAAAILALRAKALRGRSVLLVLGVLAAGWILAAGLRALPQGAPGASGPEAPPTLEARAASSMSRLELYDLSWRAWLERPLAGTGYLTFRYVLERGRSRAPSYGDSNETWFAHNDYLQTLQELGLLGLAALIALAWLPALLAYRRVPRMPLERRPVALASASGLTAMACHALVDFPFYVPVCLMLYGALLGTVDRRLGEGLERKVRTASTPSWYRAARAALAVLGTVIVVRPLAAEAAADWGLRRSAAGQPQSAAFWLEAARRLDAADWRYHWYAGQFWDGQAADSGRRDAARFAADAFATGVEANPLEVRNLLGKISVHRRHGKLLDAPADAATLAKWMAQAEALAPLNSAVRRERDLLGAAK